MDFNPRSREGSDNAGILRIDKDSVISIHAPARGATKRFDCKWIRHRISIHAPARGATANITNFHQSILFNITNFYTLLISLSSKKLTTSFQFFVFIYTIQCESLKEFLVTYYSHHLQNQSLILRNTSINTNMLHFRLIPISQIIKP